MLNKAHKVLKISDFYSLIILRNSYLVNDQGQRHFIICEIS